MMSRRCNAIFLVGLIGAMVFGLIFFVDFYRSFWGQQNIWWTPKVMSRSIDETRNTFEFFIAEALIQDHLAKETLFLMSEEGVMRVVAAEDITIRLNNLDTVRVSFLTRASITGILFGVMTALLMVGLTRQSVR